VRRVAALAGVLLAVAGCGSGSSEKVGTSIRISAASSLQDVLSSCAGKIDGVRPHLQFGGSDELAAQIRQGVKPELYMAANQNLPKKLAQEGKVDTPVAFATNELVIAVPSGDKSIHGIGDLARGDVSLAIGSVGVPIGDYTRTVIGKLPTQERIQVLSRVRSQEPDTKGIVGKLVSQAVKAGFVYRTDVTASDGKLRAVALPAALEPTVTYAMATVKDAPQPAAGRKVFEDVLHGGCARELRRAGFGPPPR
jgi:molybdate transport system substrate-binding protein